MSIKPPFSATSKRPREVRTVTICAGFRSQYGVVLCTDSQETIGAMKFDAPKLVTKPDVGSEDDQVRMLFAGAGDGPFIDKLVEGMWKSAISGPDMHCEKILQRIEDRNLEIHDKYWRVYPKEDRPLAHILFAILTDDSNPRLFRAMGPIINEVESYAFVGYGLELGTFLAENFRPDTVDIEEDVSAALFILENAKKYVDSCGGDTQIAALMIDGSISTLWSTSTSRLAEGFSDIAKDMYSLFGEAINLERSPQDFSLSARWAIREIRRTRERLKKRVPTRIKTSREIKESCTQLFTKKEWPATKGPITMQSDSQMSEDQPSPCVQGYLETKFSNDGD